MKKTRKKEPNQGEILKARLARHDSERKAIDNAFAELSVETKKFVSAFVRRRGGLFKNVLVRCHGHPTLGMLRSLTVELWVLRDQRGCCRPLSKQRSRLVSALVKALEAEKGLSFTAAFEGCRGAYLPDVKLTFEL